MEVIRELAPQLVFVDSINLLNEFGTGTAKSIKTIVDGFREVIRETGSHIVLLCQLNKQNCATGSTALGHLPDTNLVLTNFENDFKVSIGKKNRYGPKGSKFFGIWRHTKDSVVCISNNRAGDERVEEEWPELGPVPILADLAVDDMIVGEIPEVGPDDEMINIASFFGQAEPIKGPRLVSNVTLETCDPAVRETYYMLNPDKRPTVIRKIAKFVRNNWTK